MSISDRENQAEHETILGAMTFNSYEDRYEITVPSATDLRGMTVTISSSLGGAYNGVIE